MNGNSMPTQPNEGQTHSSLQGVRKFVRANLVSTITATIAGSLLLTGVSTFNIWNIYNGFQSTISKQFELRKISDTLVYQDEVLTMSARMLVSTGDLQWETRYAKMVPEAEATLKTFKASLSKQLLLDAEQANSTSEKLFAIETKAFKLVKQGKQKEAYQLLVGNEYEIQKKIYSDVNNKVLATVDKSIEHELQDYQQQLFISIAFAGVTLPVLIGSWLLVLSAVRDYIRDRQVAQAEIVASQADLLQLNERLSQEAGIRLLQEQQVRAESELLQTDVGHILDVVCEIEAGNLTVQAEVNERVTGLVSDTLNRSIESLDRIISTVVNTARSVTDNASQLEGVALETAQQAQSQAIEVRSVQVLMDKVNTLTADSRQQAIDTDAAVQSSKSAVFAGQQAMQETIDGIEMLQQGTNQIVKRTELLTEFVDLAAQFSKDQKRVASLTRVLALNASTVSSRAIRERDPEQFASLAKEFEAIARQVSTLAMDTNSSLVSLQQRTERVQTVTSGLTQDVGEIEQLVQKFTGEVSKSRQAFDNIQSVTDRVSIMGEKVNESSQDIVQVVNDTLKAIQSIAQIATVTESKATITRERVQSMGDLSRKLLEMVEFFKLTETNSLQQPNGLPSQTATAIDSSLHSSTERNLVSV
jgi:methyl-accepting chemotaxis protein PixJ